MATKTRFLPGYGVLVDAESGDEKFLPSYGAVVFQEEAAPSSSGRKLRVLKLGFRRRPAAAGGPAGGADGLLLSAAGGGFIKLMSGDFMLRAG